MNRAVMWERAGAASGIAFVALLLASFLVIPDAPPALDDPVGRDSQLLRGQLVRLPGERLPHGPGGLLLPLVPGEPRAALAGAKPEQSARLVVFPAGALTLALVLVSAAITDALATRIAAESDQAVIRALYDVQAFAIAFASFPIAALVGAVAITSSGTRLLPPLVRWLGYALVPAWLVTGCGVFVESGVFSPTGAFGFVVVLVWIAWVLAVSASLLRRTGTNTSVHAA